MKIKQIYTSCLSQASYYIESNGESLIIDPIKDINEYDKLIKKDNSKLKYVLETHFHADFISGHLEISKKYNVPIVFGPHSNTSFKSMSLNDNDLVVSMSILLHVDTTSDIRTDYLQSAAALRRLLNANSVDDEKERDKNLSENLKTEPFVEHASREEFILSITENGYGKRTSSYQFRITNRGGSGIKCITTSKRNGNVAASFPVNEGDEVILSTDKGKVIRCAVKEIRIAGRNTQGVRIIKLSGDEKVVSATKIDDNLL